MRRYHPALVALHWLLALMIVGALAAGTFILVPTANDDPSKLFSLRMHMGLGLAILALMVLRLAVRVFTRSPPAVETDLPSVNVAARVMHVALYLGAFAMALSGVALARAAGLPEIVFGGSGAPLPEDFHAFAPRAVHGALATVLMVLVAVHVLAALWHQFVRRDGLMARMWFGAR
ncbi:MAG: cytochrome b [Rhodobacteraceae bacterium]|nr:cytochrome b [Paracoccaceae bacterium]